MQSDDLLNLSEYARESLVSQHIKIDTIFRDSQASKTIAKLKDKVDCDEDLEVFDELEEETDNRQQRIKSLTLQQIVEVEDSEHFTGLRNELTVHLRMHCRALTKKRVFTHSGNNTTQDDSFESQPRKVDPKQCCICEQQI